MKNNFILLLSTFLLFNLGHSQCNIQASICEPGVAGPFTFDAATPNVDFYEGCLNNPNQGDNLYGFILLNITTGGPLEILINGNLNVGFMDVIVFSIPEGEDPCNAALFPANEIGCGYAQNNGGCIQFGNAFGCNSSFPAPMVNAGDQVLIIVQSWGNFVCTIPSPFGCFDGYNEPGSTTFTLELSGSGAQTGPLDGTINPTAPICVSDLPVTLTAVTGGGQWSASCGACIDSNTGEFNPSTAGTGTHTINYTVGAPPCGATGDPVEVTVVADTPSEFTDLGPYCVGETPGVLPTTSTNGITGTWNPAVISTATAGTTNYVFTPNAGECGEPYTMEVTVNAGSTSSEFTDLGPYCEGDTPGVLPTTSDNGFTGTWNPAVISTATAGTSNYEFTPDAGQCAMPYTMEVTINTGPPATFTDLGPYCEGGTPGALPTTSNDGFTGTWNPAVISTVTAGTSNYEFTPDAGQCASPYTMEITVNAGTASTFTDLGPYCEGETPGVLPTTSTNGFTGTWNPATISTATIGTDDYLFTPDAGQCALEYTMEVTITSGIVPDFTDLGPYCQDGAADPLPTTSNDGFTGTWNPAVVSTAVVGTSAYLFTPDGSSSCALEYTMDITIDAPIVSDFTDLGPYCQGDTPGVLSGTSNNGVAGTWSPAVVSTASSGMTQYVFTPSAGECATVYNMEIEITAPNPTEFTDLGPYCQDDTPGILPTTSTNGFTGTWNPATISTANSGITTYTFTPDAGQCADFYEMEVEVYALPNVTTISDQVICDGNSMTLFGDGATIYVWDNGVDDGVPFVPAIGSETYTVIGTDANGCSNSASVVVTVVPSPNAEFTASEEFGLPGIDVDFENLSSNGTTYTWDFGNGDGDVTATPSNTGTTYNDPGVYTVTLIVDNGVCTDSYSTIITVQNLPLSFTLPNIFTPNGDNSNDIMHFGLINAERVYVEIFNRWGNQVGVIDSVDPNDGWNGLDMNSGNPVSEGVYFYTYEIEDLEGEVITGHQYIHLKR